MSTPVSPSMKFSRDQKTPGESLPWNFDFSDEDVFAASPITAATFTDWYGNPLVGITVGTPAVSSPVVQARISGGTANSVYIIKCRASNAAGDVREAFLALYVRLPTPDPA